MAKKVKSQAKAKEQVKKQPEKQGEKLLLKVPEEYVFCCHDGTIFRDMKELADNLTAMSDEIYIYHVTPERNDFANWVRDVIKDDDLANELALATDKSQATEYVKVRLTFLTGK